MASPTASLLAAPLLASATALAALLLPQAANAQRGCATTTYTDPPRQELDCSGGVAVSAEQRSAYRIVDRAPTGAPTVINLNGGALLVQTPSRRGPLQIRTPHAIASVRGTVWAVDVTSAKTAVFVRSGAVNVRRTGGGASVTLGPGEGVDVDGGSGPLQVNRWGEGRVSNLLARFGR